MSMSKLGAHFSLCTEKGWRGQMCHISYQTLLIIHNPILGSSLSLLLNIDPSSGLIRLERCCMLETLIRDVITSLRLLLFSALLLVPIPLCVCMFIISFVVTVYNFLGVIFTP